MLTKLVTAILQNYFPFVIKNQTFNAKKCNITFFEVKITLDGLLFRCGGRVHLGQFVYPIYHVNARKRND